ncbi:MAG: hypothetical protein HQK76_20110 [Desulfobacterales bacterium]|nr:hypothetical protein [Desulfobacterales bacterium]
MGKKGNSQKKRFFVALRLLMLCLLCIFILINNIDSVYAESIYVFYPTPISPKDFKEELSKVFPEIEWSVFSRFKDFDAMIKQNPPEAVIALTPTINEIGGYKVTLKASFQGSSKDIYMLVSPDSSLNPGNISDVPVATYDILGRKSLENFFKQFFEALPKLERVSKMEDLVTLLSLNMVKGIIVQNIYLNYFKERSEREFTVNPIPKMEIDGLSLGIKEGASPDNIEKAVKGLTKNKVSFVEVDQWN